LLGKRSAQRSLGGAQLVEALGNVKVDRLAYGHSYGQSTMKLPYSTCV
jgi:hypothetical protein